MKTYKISRTFLVEANSPGEACEKLKNASGDWYAFLDWESVKAVQPERPKGWLGALKAQL